jgi:nucleotide-binding universal stress UspA family protein
MKFKKIVVAVDLDPKSLTTLSQIKDMELAPDAEVHLVHVFEYTFLNFDIIPGMKLGEEDLFLIERAIMEKLEGIKRELGLDKGQRVKLKCLLSVGAKQEFVQYLDEEKPDLVVAASQEKAGLAGFFEGSFSAFLTKFARPNLMLLRPKA